ncbi:MAG TPA: sulfite exporter TauE/SafE family protein [Spirochaetales bacterium]|nr:sulfite exporter TauE/SafE family protein [Spirochaetales bacterium]
MTEIATVFLAGFVVFVTHALEAITGFGCTVLALPFITALFGVKQGVEVLTILAWILSLYIVITKHKDIAWHEFGKILAFVLAGLPIGMYLFHHVDSAPLKRVLSYFIIVAASIQLVQFVFPKVGQRRMPKAVGYVLLFLGGIIHGIFSSGGPLIVLYASHTLPEKGRFRATLCLLWVTLNSIIIGSYVFSSSITQPVATKTLVMLPFLAAGIVAGEWAHQRVKPDTFKVLIFSTLLLTGIVMLVA